MTAQMPFDTILVANRGEIALRVMRTAKSMGLRTVAVFSEVDEHAPHVKFADDAVLIGPAPVAASYLNGDEILEAARKTGARAVHPGYGFLSENAGFAQACQDAGLVFIGPTPDAIDLMGDKAKAKRRMISAGVPCVPGYQGEDQSDATLIAEAKTIGLPVMVKAAAGGGGRGMRLVADEKDLPAAIATARSEAENAFGSGDLIIEKAVINPRHIEIQVFADLFGNTIYLGERDCSVQRRHQKVLEEAPSPFMTEELRAEMGAAAVKAAMDIGYVGAGTVEFLVDENRAFYFLEMNTRLQVEHPVTELVTGLDLVALQINVAQGREIGLTQNDVAMRGHAIEARLYAEDPSQDFLPATGPVDYWRPAVGEGIRVDDGIKTGGAVSPFYDPMVAKVMGYGATREEARRRLIKALSDTVVFGFENNRAFLIDALERDAFVAGDATTAFIHKEFGRDDLEKVSLSSRDAVIGAVILFELSTRDAHAQASSSIDALKNWSSASTVEHVSCISAGEEKNSVTLKPDGPQCYQAMVEDETFSISVLSFSDHDARLDVDGARIDVAFNAPLRETKNAALQFQVGQHAFDVLDENAVIAASLESVSEDAVIAPMHGMLVDLFAKAGAQVVKGERLAVLEAMKMQHELLAPRDGVIQAIHAKAGEQVAADVVLIEFAD